MTKPGPHKPTAAEIQAARDAETKKTLDFIKKQGK
jgi:hypothetical protein